MFALGVTAYETITGQLPWEKAESMQMLLSHMNSPGKDRGSFVPISIPPLSSSSPSAWNVMHGRSFQTPTEFRLALQAFAEERLLRKSRQGAKISQSPERERGGICSWWVIMQVISWCKSKGILLTCGTRVQHGVRSTRV